MEEEEEEDNEDDDNENNEKNVDNDEKEEIPYDTSLSILILNTATPLMKPFCDVLIQFNHNSRLA